MKKAEINLIKTADINIEDLTPAMQEYLKIKHQNPDKILLYRLGDFYETFFEDAVTMSKELELTLTGREQGKFGRIPLAGIPARGILPNLPCSRPVKVNSNSLDIITASSKNVS